MMVREEGEVRIGKEEAGVEEKRVPKKASQMSRCDRMTKL